MRINRKYENSHDYSAPHSCADSHEFAAAIRSPIRIRSALMKHTENLEKLLESLKSEIPSREASRWKGVRPELGAHESSDPKEEQWKPPPGMHHCPHREVWSENKEAILMGMLASVCVVIAGVASGLDYVVMIGGAAFAVFVFIMAWVIIEFCVNLRKPGTTKD